MFMSRFIRTDYHTEQIFIPHRLVFEKGRLRPGSHFVVPFAYPSENSRCVTETDELRALLIETWSSLIEWFVNTAFSFIWIVCFCKFWVWYNFIYTLIREILSCGFRTVQYFPLIG